MTFSSATMTALRAVDRRFGAALPPRVRRHWLYFKVHGRWGSFTRPSTFTEKVNWRILHDRREMLSWTCDKLQMKQHAAEAGAPMRVPATLWSGLDVRELAQVPLPERWVLKPSHRSGLVHFGEGATDVDVLARQTSSWLTDVEGEYLAEWAYTQAVPRFFVEEFIGEVGSTPTDYKFFVFDGEPRLIQVDVNRFAGHRRSLFTPDWVQVDIELNDYPSAGEVPTPDLLPQMLECARMLGQGFDFMRIDLYVDGGDVVFGEYTPYPGSGLTQLRPRQFDRELGALWTLPSAAGPGALASVVLHNADGVNPYGTEIAALLHGRGHRVTLCDASNGGHRPPAGIVWRRVLPANFGPRTKAGQLRRLVRGLATTVWRSAVRRDVVLVSSVQLPVENIVLAALAALGRPVVHVQHDPVRRRAESRVSRWGRRQILLRATVAVVHAQRLRADVDPAALDHVVVCPHPPYAVTTPDATTAVGTGGSDGIRWLAFIGTLRRDKGIDLLPEILSRVPAERRRQLGLVICGRGELSDAAWQQLRDTGVEIRDLTSSQPVEHDALLEVLRQRPLVLAPYVAATQSGSVIMALSMGCRVLAFDKGGIPDVVTPEGLVPNGDLDAFADALATGRSGSSRIPLEEWADSAASSWSAVVEQAAASGRTVPPGASVLSSR